MADGLLLLWWLGIDGCVLGAAAHVHQTARYWRYRPRARHRAVVDGWIFDEVNRAAVKTILALWGLARLGLIAARAPSTVGNPMALDLDLLTLALYWGLLLLFTHWTWRVRRTRAREDVA